MPRNNTETIRFFIPGTPLPQERHRSKGYLGNDGHGNLKAKSQIYDPSKRAKVNLFDFVYRFRPKKPWEGPVRADLVFYMPIPKKRPRFMSINVYEKLKPGDPHIVKPDKDNLEKFVLDALRGPVKDQRSGMKLPPVFFMDDCQVYDGKKTKIYAEPGKEGTLVTLQAIK